MKDWFFELQPRERWIVLAGVVVVLLTILYVGIWEPLSNGHRLAREDVERKADLVARARQLSPGPTADAAGNASDGGSLVVIVSNSAYANGLSNAYRNSSPSGDNGLRVTLENAAFDDIVKWLGALQSEHSISVQSSSVTRRREQGRVDASVVLGRSI